MKHFGYCMGGSEEAVEAKIREVIGRFSHFNYLEIGIGEGQTLKTVSDIATEVGANHTILGIDINGGRHFDPSKFLSNRDKTIAISNGWCPLREYQITVWLGGSPFTTQFIQWQLHYVLIDGCHCADCTIKDFEAIEHLVPIGGVVAFHDAGESDQVNEPQCQPDRGIRVIEALTSLGLYANERRHWQEDGYAAGERSTRFYKRVS